MKPSNNPDDIVYFHKWTSSQPILAETFSTVVFEDGGKQHCQIGKVEIIENDLLYLDYGANRQVYTRSGKGYESEYPYGRVSLHGCPIGVTLTAEQSQHVKKFSSTRAEFELMISQQQKRVEPLINQLASEYVAQENIRRKQRVEEQILAKQRREKMISEALDKMDKFFNRNQNQDSETPNITPSNKNKPR